MKTLYRVIEKVADTDSTVVIYGESGTGKELVAKTIHLNSNRCRNAFVPLNCGAVPRELIESELFGHEKGAFTGAVNTRIGRFELAGGGTILLDEIGELELPLQVKLLRVLQEREFERVGSTRTIKADVRVLAATNRDLEKAIKDGSFREDLYYRLNVIPLVIPPLRERREDVPLLIEHFMNRYCKKRDRKPLIIPKETMDVLTAYPWPGNVRELENLVERLLILNDTGTVTTDELPERFRSNTLSKEFPVNNLPDLPQNGVNLSAMLNEIEKNMIIQALERAGGVKNKAADILGLNRTTLLEKIKKKGIDIKET